MIKLSEHNISATPSTANTLKEDEQKSLLKEIPQWEINRYDDQNQLERNFTLKNFEVAMNFSNQISVVSEEFDHHPMLVIEWGKVKVVWWSHSIKGLHQNDFVMAAKTDEIFNNL